MKNTKMIRLFLWVFPAILGILLLLYGVVMIMHTSYIIIIPIVALEFGVVKYYAMVLKAKGKTEKFLKQHSSEKLIDFFEQTYDQVKDQKKIDENQIQVIKIYHIALTYCCYGEFEKAEMQLTEIDWSHQTLLNQSLQLRGLAIIAMLRDYDFKESLNLLIRSRNLASQPNKYSEYQEVKNEYNLFVDFGEGLNGGLNFKEVYELEKEFGRSSYILSKLIGYWGLANIYHKHGDSQKVNELLSYCKKIAPYCNPLHEVAR